MNVKKIIMLSFLYLLAFISYNRIFFKYEDNIYTEG